MHQTAIIVRVDNDVCAYINGQLCGENLKYISFDSIRGREPHLLYAIDERIPNSKADMEDFIYLIGCILEGWNSVEESQSKNLTWLEAVKQMPLDLFAGTVFSICQTEKTEERFKARLLEKFPEEIAPALHLMKTDAISLIPGYVPANSRNNHLEPDT